MTTTTKQQKIQVGVFAFVAIALVALVLVVFGGMHFWRHRDNYYIVYDDSVYGLEQGADVYLSGIRVGDVKSIKLEPDDIRHVRIEIELDGGTPVRTDTKATLTMAGITGLKVIDLKSGSNSAPRLPEGGTIAIGETTLDRLERQALSIADQSTELMTHVNKIMVRAEHVVTNLDGLTDPAQFGDLVSQLRATAGNLVGASSSMRSLIDSNRKELHASIVSIDQAARGVSDLVDGQVAGMVANFGDFMTQLKTTVRGDGVQLNAAMSDLRQASRSIKELAREVRDQPSRLLFSKPEPDRKLP